MKKVLIYIYKNQLVHRGGPIGYNYNLNCQLEKMNVHNIHFIESNDGDYTQMNSHINKIRPIWLRTVIIIAKRIIGRYKLLYGNKHRAAENLNKYDLVHFHGVYTMYACKDDLENYKGTVVLTSHAPRRASLELYDSLTNFEKKYFHWLYKKLFVMDEYGFNRADYIIFPCPEAEEPYFNTWAYYTEFKKNNEHKYRYLLSGIDACKTRLSRNEVRKNYNIPEDAFVISFAGRHNTVKGYDILKLIGEEMLNSDNIYFLVAGNEMPIKGLKHEHWIEVGWTNDPYSIIASSDVFVLPNRETYFDLVLLEVLSLSTIVLASDTGGNKYFKKLEPNGVILFDGVKDAIYKLEYIRGLSSEKKTLMCEQNYQLFQKYFSSEVFAQSYVDLISKL